MIYAFITANADKRMDLDYQQAQEAYYLPQPLASGHLGGADHY